MKKKTVHRQNTGAGRRSGSGMKKGCFLFVCLLLAAALVALLWGEHIANSSLKMLYPRAYSELVEQNAADFSLDENLIYAVIRAESKFDANAQSSAQAKGLMQLTQETFDWILTKYPAETQVPDIWNPADNIHAGCAMLRLLIDQFGSVDVALTAYNAGMGNVSKWLENREYSNDNTNLHTIPFAETKAYVEQVLANMKIYQKLYGHHKQQP